MKYDYIIVGSGLFGAVCAHELKKSGKSVLVIEKRKHIAGNIYTKNIDGINVHEYGAHIFHTNSKKIWNYVNKFVEFNRFTNAPLAKYDGKMYNLPFNMNTFYQLWGCKTPLEAKKIIQEQRSEVNGIVPSNLEEQAISLVGRDIYEKLIKGYTEKQWGRACNELPSFIIKRLPVRYTFDNNYFNDLYQGIPIGGYTNLVEKLLTGIDVELNVDFLENIKKYRSISNQIIYTGSIDEYFNNEYGKLEYRTLRFEHEKIEIDDYQGNAVVNYTEREVPFTRIIEHKHFDPVNVDSTIITKEYPSEWKPGDEAYYPVNDEKNMSLFKKYRERANKEQGVIFGGRLAEYKYYDMHQVIASAFSTLNKIEGIQIETE